MLSPTGRRFEGRLSSFEKNLNNHLITLAAMFPFLTFHLMAFTGKDADKAESVRVIKVQTGPAIHQDSKLVNQLQKTERNVKTAKPVYNGFKAYRVSANHRVIRYQQYYNGVKVFGHQVIGRFDEAGVLKEISGSYLEGIEKTKVQSSPAFNESEAGKIGKNTLSKGNWIFENEKIELVLYHDGKTILLAYYLNFFADNTDNSPTRPFFLIDALTGTIIKQWEGLANTDVGNDPGYNGQVGQHE